ncbi:ATP-binding protein [Priestia megaterium]|uniref:ATP-binding protein n=1 Tax=Priestia megaterium TaxID=1404 RepID=UPI0037C67374
MIPKYEQYPIKHIDGNLTFGHDNTVWAHFKIHGYNYDLRDENGKISPFKSQLDFFKRNTGDIQLSSIPIPTNIDSIINRTIDTIKNIDYPLQKQGIAYMNSVKKSLNASNVKTDSTEYHDILSVQLKRNANHVKDVNMGNSLIQTVYELVKGIKSPLYQAFGLDPSDILQKEIDAYHKEAKDMQLDLQKSFKCKVELLSTKQTIYLLEQHYSVGLQEIELKEDFEPSEEIEGVDPKGTTHKAKRPNPTNFHDLQNAEVQEIDRQTLLIQRLVDNDIKESYVRYYVCSNIPVMPQHPGWEWLYKIQSELDFPVAFSVRGHHVKNDKTIKLLSNALLEINDQKDEAKKVGETAEDDVLDTERGAVQMQTLFKKNGWPSYNCSFIFRVSAKDKDTLDTNAKELLSLMNTYSMELIAPFGEQMNFFNESMLGSRRFCHDYEMKVSPHILAGLMFGATTRIGDNRGVYFAQTIKKNRPVFLQMDLAAKRYKNIKTLYDSISIMVAGMTGKGKSVLMNLLTYLHVLMGSLALIIDPKGDRRNWAEGLPFIPKEYISVWTLGESNQDNGCLDPFRLCPDPEEARDLALEIISHMANIKIGDLTFTLLSQYIDKVMDHKDPCLGAVLDYIMEQEKEIVDNNKSYDPRKESIINLAGTLQSIRSHKLGRLLFSEIGQKTRTLQVDKPMQVLMVQNLQLPENGKAADTPAGKFSEMVMLSLTAFTKQYMLKQDRYRHKIILQDEAASIERSATGSVLLDFVVTKGRYYNTSLIKGTQNASSFGSDSNNIGMKFSMALPNEEEAVTMLKFMNLPITKENTDLLQHLDNGRALFQDIRGRCAAIRINPVFDEVLEAFNTSTSTKEEREAEEQRELEEVGA